MSQLRLNPLTGRWITIVADRAERPTDFAPRRPLVEGDPNQVCPFCPGNEEQSAPPLELYPDAHGHWQVRVVPNRYPAFAGDDPLTVSNLGPIFQVAPASGAHEVLIFSPEHRASWATLDTTTVELVMRAIRERFKAHAGARHVRYTQMIVNYGREAGASLSHPHAQLIGMPFVPGTILDEEAGFARFEGGCLMCTTIEAELAAAERVVASDDAMTVVAPYWSGTPYELLVIPNDHHSHVERTPEECLTAAGLAVRDSLQRLRHHLGDLAYNVVLHSSPYRHDSGYHWHLHVWPKLESVAGFERGTGVSINIVPPEDATEALRVAVAV